MSTLAVERNDARSRYEGRCDGELVSLVDYVLRGDTMIVIHTGTEHRWRGRGYAAQVTQAHQSLTLDELYQMIREGADGVVNRGKAEPGDKTMCDVWLPVVESLRHSSEQHLSIPAALDAACEVAERAAHATITMQARKGRASYLGERSIGHQDPGATSVLFMVQMLAAAAKE